MAQADDVTVDEVLSFFDTLVSQGTLWGQGDNYQVQEANLKTERRWLVLADKFSDREGEGMKAVCPLLKIAYKGSDGEDRDLVAGAFKPVLSMLIHWAGSTYGCTLRKDLDINVFLEFVETEGHTVADETGLTYYVDGNMYHDPSYVYPEELWGSYPLYFPAHTANIRSIISYNGPAEQAEVRVETLVYPLNTDGSFGDILDQSEVYLTLYKGEVVLSPSYFVIPLQPKGLMQVFVTVYHEDKLIMTKEAIFCPPDHDFSE
jgi:hypothetical protein